MTLDKSAKKVYDFMIYSCTKKLILWFSIRYAAAHREIFGVNTLGGKLYQLGSPNLQEIFIGG